MTEELSQISEREREILQIVASGATNQQIAQQLHISVHTVKVHLRNIYSKIGVESRTEATVYAVRYGLVQVIQPTPESNEPPSLVDKHVSSTTQEPTTPTSSVADPPGDTSPDTLTDPPGDTSLDLPTNTPTTQEGQHNAPPIAQPPVPQEIVLVATDTTNTSTSDTTNTTPVPVSVPSVPSVHPMPMRPTWMHHPVLLIVLAILSVVLALALVFTLMQQRESVASPTDTTLTMLTQSANPPVINQIQAEPSRWNTHTAMQEPHAHFAVVPYDYDGKIYVIGGTKDGIADDEVQRYDPDNAVWVSLNAKPTAVSHIQAATIGGLIYVPGGEGQDGTVLDIFEAYDPRNKRWQQLPPLPAPRSQYALTSFEGQLYLFGGWDGQQYCDEVFIYDSSTETWREGEPLPTPRRNAGAAVAEDRIYVLGGENGDGALALNERYDTTIGGDMQHWESTAPLPIPIAQPAVAAVVNTFFVFDAATHTAQQYTPATDAWATLALPDDVASPARVAPLRTSLFILSMQDDEKTPGAVSEYRAVFMLFLPDVRK